MNRVRALAVFALALLAACGSPGTPGGSAPGPAASDEVISQRVIDYFQKSVTTPGIAFKVTKLEDAEVPGWRKGDLEAALGPQTQHLAFYVSRDGRFLFRGDAVDLSVDPLKKVVDAISLGGQPVRGPESATVTIVEYSDFQCPFCARVYTMLEDQILKEYGDKVRFVFKNFPLTNIHPWAEDAAVASECAFQQGNDKFWVMYSGLFAKQAELSKDNLAAKATEIATAGGLDTAAFQQCMEGRTSLDAVKADQNEAAGLGVNSTPTFFVNGRRLSGAVTFETFKQLLDQELGGAKG